MESVTRGGDEFRDHFPEHDEWDDAEEEDEFVHADKIQRGNDEGDGDEGFGFEGGFAQAPECLEDDGDDDGLDAVENAFGLRESAVTDISPGAGDDDEHGGDDEANAGDDEPRPAAATMADVDGHFGGVRAGDEVGGAEEIEEFGFGEPLAAADDFILHHGNVGGGSTKGGEAKLEEKRR